MYEKNNSCHPVTLEWFSIQLLVNSEIFKLLLNLSLTHLRAQSTYYELKGDLGVILDPHLTYDHHISKTVSSCFSKLYQINRVKKNFDKQTLKQVITSLVFSKMLYCSTVWSNTSTQNINKLQSIQNFASRIVTNSRKFDHVTPLLRQIIGTLC